MVAVRWRDRLPQLIWTGRRRLVALEHEVLAELRALRDRTPDITGVLAASVDGLLVAQDAPGVEPEALAAMSAASLGLGQQMSRGAGRGEFRETVIRAGGGYVATFAAGGTALLTVIAGADLNVGRLHHEARPVAERVGQLVAAAGRLPPCGRHFRGEGG